MADKLPTPATASDMYASAIVTELRSLNTSIKKLVSALEAPQPDDSGEVELREPKPTTRDAKKAADKTAKDAFGPVTVERQLEVVKPDKKG